MNANEKLIKIRDCFRNLADTIDEMIAIDEREAAGEDENVLAIEMQKIVGKYVIFTAELESLK